MLPSGWLHCLPDMPLEYIALGRSLPPSKSGPAPKTGCPGWPPPPPPSRCVTLLGLETEEWSRREGWAREACHSLSPLHFLFALRFLFPAQGLEAAAAAAEAGEWGPLVGCSRVAPALQGVGQSLGFPGAASWRLSPRTFGWTLLPSSKFLQDQTPSLCPDVLCPSASCPGAEWQAVLSGLLSFSAAARGDEASTGRAQQQRGLRVCLLALDLGRTKARAGGSNGAGEGQQGVSRGVTEPPVEESLENRWGYLRLGGLALHAGAASMCCLGSSLSATDSREPPVAQREPLLPGLQGDATGRAKQHQESINVCWLMGQNRG